MTKQQQVSPFIPKAPVRASEPLKALAVRDLLLSVCLSGLALFPSPLSILCSQTFSISSDPVAMQAGQAFEEEEMLPKPPKGWGLVPRVCSGTQPALSAQDSGGGGGSP